MDDDDEILDSAPISKSDEELEKGFVAAIVEQPKLMDELAKQLVALSLAIPGIYATALKLLAGDDAVASSLPCIIGAFVFWALSLVFAFVSLTPRKWHVERTMLRRNSTSKNGAPLSIEEFFIASARYKRALLIAATACCFVGICLACVAVFTATPPNHPVPQPVKP